MVAAVSGSVLAVDALQMPLKIIDGPEPLCSLATASFGAFMRLLMPRSVLSARVMSLVWW